MLPFHCTWKKAHLYATLTLRSVDEILWCYHSNETSLAVLSYGAIYYKYVVLTFESVNEILCCYHSNETYLAVLCIVLSILRDFRKKNLKFLSEFYLWLLAEILSKFKVILNVIFRWRKKSEWMFKWRRKCKTSPSSVSMCFHSTLCQATEEVWVELDAEYTHQQV